MLLEFQILAVQCAGCTISWFRCTGETQHSPVPRRCGQRAIFDRQCVQTAAHATAQPLIQARAIAITLWSPGLANLAEDLSGFRSSTSPRVLPILVSKSRTSERVSACFRPRPFHFSPALTPLSLFHTDAEHCQSLETRQVGQQGGRPHRDPQQQNSRGGTAACRT